MVPIEQVSHDAALRVKKYCKIHNTEVLFLRSSSISSVSLKLTELSQ